MVWKTVTPSFTGDTQHFGGVDINKISNLFSAVLDVDSVDINSSFTIRSSKGKIRNPANTFSYTIAGSAIAADRTLTLPLLTANDTVDVLGLAQTFTGVKTFDTYSDLKEMSAPAAPLSTYHRLYVDVVDGHVKRKNSANSIIDLETGGGGGSSVVQPYDFFIYKSGANYIAINGVTNALDYTSTSFLTVISSVITALTTGGRILLGRGDFSLTTLLTVLQNNITIQGFGVDVTRIVFNTPLTTGVSIRVGTTALGTVHTLTANALKGQRVITATSTGIAANDWIFLNRLVPVDATSLTRYDAEFHKVMSVDSGTQITVDTNIYEDYNTTDTATYYKVPWVTNFTLKDLTIFDNRGDNNVATAGDGPIHCIFCYGLSLRNVKLEGMSHDSIRIEGCFNTSLDNLYIETPVSTADDPDHEYGVYLTGASTNFSWNGGWANNCRHSITNNTNSGGVYRRGRQRNITVTGVTSYNANVAHFDLHQCALGATFVGCVTLGGQHSTVSVDVQGFNLRSPATITGCSVLHYQHEGIVVWIDGDVVGSDLAPGGNRSVITGCTIQAPLKDDVDTVTRGIIVQANRSTVVISNNSFFDINQESIILEDAVSNVIITGNTFHSCGLNLAATNGTVRTLGTVNDLIITNNIFGAGIPSPLGRPLVSVTAINRLVFTGNDLNGLTNKSPTLVAASTDCRVMNNVALNPLNQITNHTNTTNNTIGFYGGTTATVVASIDYKIVGTDILLTVTGGTGVSATIKDGAGNTVVAGLTTPINAQLIPVGYKINFGAFSVAPTTSVFSI